jgi:hypothetical protein
MGKAQVALTAVHYPFPDKRSFMKLTPIRTLFIAALVLIISGLSMVSARVIQLDGRINQVSHFGGDAFYCIDSNGNPTTQFGENGFLLLDINGQPLWRIEAATIEAAVASAQAQGGTVLVAEGQGTYGPAQLYVQVLSNGDYEFYFFANDEYFKQNSMVFKFCRPEGVAEEVVPTGEPTAEPTDEPIEYCYAYYTPQGPASPAADAVIAADIVGPIIPCSDCPLGTFTLKEVDLPICLGAG